MDQAFVDLIDKIREEEKQLVGVEIQSLSGQTIDDIYDPAQDDPDYVPSATEQYEDQQDEDYKYSPSRDTALYHDQNVDDEELDELEYELDESLSPYQRNTNDDSSSIDSDESRSDDVSESNESEDDANEMDIEVHDKHNDYQEQSTQPKEKFKNTPYAGESQQDYFGNVNNTSPNNMEETSIASSRPFRSS